MNAEDIFIGKNYGLYTKYLYVIILLHVIIGEEVWSTETSSKN